MLFKQLFATVTLFGGALVDAYANPGACSGSCWSHDPSVIQRSSDGVYFRFDTGGGMQITKSSSLSGPWTIEGVVLPSGSKVAVTGNTGSDAWAPDVHLISGTYYLYYAISSFGSQVSTIGVATSTTLEAGSWTDHGSAGIASSTSKIYNAIDPNLVVAGSTYLMNFGSFWDDIYQVPMSTPLVKSSSSSYNIAYNSSGTHAEEGSYMFYYSGYYYLLMSSGSCCGLDTNTPAQGDEYRIIMCRSTSATGSFVDKSGVACTAGGGTTLLASHSTIYAPGGQGVYTDTSRGLVLYYHYLNKDVGIADADTLFGWNTLTWSGGWPSV